RSSPREPHPVAKTKHKAQHTFSGGNMRMNRAGRIVWTAVALFSAHAIAGVGTLVGDTYVSSANPANNFGAATLINVGGGNAGLVQFDLSRALSQLISSPNVPGTATPVIGRATLTVYASKTTSAGTLQARALLGSWTES